MTAIVILLRTFGIDDHFLFRATHQLHLAKRGSALTRITGQSGPCCPKTSTAPQTLDHSQNPQRCAAHPLVFAKRVIDPCLRFRSSAPRACRELSRSADRARRFARKCPTRRTSDPLLAG